MIVYVHLLNIKCYNFNQYTETKHLVWHTQNDSSCKLKRKLVKMKNNKNKLDKLMGLNCKLINTRSQGI